MNIKVKISRILKERNLNVHQLARAAGVNHETIYAILNEKSKNPGVYTVKKITDYLGITIDELLK